MLQKDVRARFPENSIQQVLVLRHGDDPAIEPGQTGVRMIVSPSPTTDGSELPLEAFHRANQGAIRQLGRDLPRLVGEGARLEISDGEKSLFLMGFGSADERAAELTPVMARLGRADLDTLDTLIAAGIAPNRAEAVRWALARIRERPAYEQIRARILDIGELKAQL